MTPHFKGNFVEIHDLVITPIPQNFRLILPNRVTYRPTVPQTVQRYGVCSAAYGTVHYKV